MSIGTSGTGTVLGEIITFLLSTAGTSRVHWQVVNVHVFSPTQNLHHGKYSLLPVVFVACLVICVETNAL